MEDVVNPWQGRRVFLTGHTGFKGSWLALWLTSLGARVRGYALDPGTEPNLFTVAGVGAEIEDVRGDVRDMARVSAALCEFAPEIVFHLAAQPLVRHSYQNPVETYGTNVMGTVHVLDAVRAAPSVRAVVCVTSDKCYQNQEWAWPYRETDPLGGYDPYASSKACAELVTAAYRQSFFPTNQIRQHGVAIASARAGNVIGGGDWSADRLIPDLLRGFTSRKTVVIRNPKAVRPWQHVLDPLHGYLALAEALIEEHTEFATAFNFGPGDHETWAVERIADRLVSLWGQGASWIQDSSSNPHEARLLRLDSSRARHELNWHPRLGVEAALQWTMKWFLDFQNGMNMRTATLDQIADYQQLTS